MLQSFLTKIVTIFFKTVREILSPTVEILRDYSATEIRLELYAHRVSYEIFFIVTFCSINTVKTIFLERIFDTAPEAN